MRVITGSARGRKLFGPKSDLIRPAIDKVKQAVFNILGDTSGLRVLDLFAGTGSMGIEALSRGATQATFVDQLPEAIQLIKKNLEMCQFLDRSEIVKMNIPPPIYLPSPLPTREGKHDLIFVDPPYDKELVNPTLQWLANQKLLAPSGIVVVEHSPRELIHPLPNLQVYDERKYGQTLISFLKGNPP